MQTKPTFYRLILLICLSFVAGILCFPPGASAGKKKVLILHSYHQGLPWTDNIMAGMNSVLNQTGMDLDIHVEYLDTKRHPPETAFSYLDKMFQQKYRLLKFDVILVSDNNALNFILSRRGALFPDVPVVFCGINHFSREMLGAHRRVTGVTEEIDIKGTIDLALRVMPGITHFLVVNDRTPTGKLNRAKFEQTAALLKPSWTFEICDSLSAKNLQKKVAGLGQDSAVLVFTFHRDGEGKWFSISDFLTLIRQSCSSPVFSLWDHYIGHGVLGGVMVSGREQGARCAEYAVRILNNESADALPILLKSPNVPMFDGRLIRQFKIPEEKIPEDAVILFRPESVLKKYKKIIWLSALSFILLVVLIVTLSFNTLIRRKAERELKEREMRLKHLNRVLTAIRIINRLITHEKDRDQLLQKACRSMVETRGFHKALIILTENGRPVEPFFHTGFGDAFDRIAAHLREEKSLYCAGEALEKRGVQVAIEKEGLCSGCPLLESFNCRKQAGLFARLEYNGHVYGWMAVAVSREFAGDEEELRLLCETADDLSLALWMLDEELRQQALEQKYAAVLTATSDAIITSDLSGRITLFNPAAEQLFQCPAEEVLGTDISRFCPEDLVDEKEELLRRVRNGEAVQNIETERLTADRRRVPVEMTINRIVNESGTPVGVSGILRDIGERKKLEERLQQAQKMEAIGTLTGGIAHDFNNILFPLMGFAEMIEEEVAHDSRTYEYIREILRATFRARDLVKQLLNFSRQSDLKKEPTLLSPIVKEVVKLLRATIPAIIDIRQNVDPECGRVMIDPTQLHQILMNLGTNAYHAMEKEGGRLTLTLDEIRLDTNSEWFPVLSPGLYARLIVSDTGPGIPESVVDKIFTPYFTTKQNGKGTGLGLSIVQGIVKSCNGDIRVYSETGKGTQIHVCLPVIKNEIGAETSAGGGQIPEGNNERILLVDDEKAILDIEGHMLNRMGYQVVKSIGSLEALEQFKADPYAFDLMVTDMNMPDMSGIQLITEIRRIRADIPTVICTGFSEQIDEEKIEAFDIQGFVMKPIIRRELAGIIYQALHKEEAADDVNEKNN